MALVTMRVMTPRPAIGGRYRLGDKLGQGAAGVVWQAWDVRLGRTVAVKQLTIPPGLAGADARRAHADAAREGRIAARLQHPAVAAMLDMVVEDGSSWLVMEHAPGRSLLAALEEKPLRPIQVARIGAELADALAVAHAAGVVHCDVKPANVLLGDDGTVKLADFGIARAVRGERMTGPLVLSGTPLFMAPEVARGTWPDGASDVWSLAATLYAAVEGTGPFGAMDHDDPVAMIRRVAEAAPRPPRRAGPLTAVLTSLLAVDPAARPTAAATRDLLREIASPSTSPVAVAPSAAPGTPRVTAPRPPRRARTLTALSTLGVVGVGAVAGTVGGGSVLAAVTSTAPAPFDHIAILGGAPDGASAVAGPSSGATVGMPAGPGLDQETPPVPAMGAPIVPESDGSSASSVSSSSGDGAGATTSRAVSDAAAQPSTGSADQALPVDAGVIHDVPLAGPVLGDTVSGVGSTVDHLPVDLGVGDGPLGLPVHVGGGDGPLGLPVNLPVDLGGGEGGSGPLGLPVNLPVDLGSGGGEGPLGLPVNLPVDLGGGEGGSGPLGLPVSLPVDVGSSGSTGAGGSDGLPVTLPVDLGGDGPLGLPLGGSTNASSDAGSSSGSATGSGSASSGSSLLGLPGGLLGGGSGSSNGSGSSASSASSAGSGSSASSGSSESANGSDDSDGTSGPTASAGGERSASTGGGSSTSGSGGPLSVLSFPGAMATSDSDSSSRSSSGSGSSDSDSSSSGSSGSRSSDSGSGSSRTSGESDSQGATSTLGSVLRAAG